MSIAETSINEGIKMLGDSWTLSIIDCLAQRPLRFNEIQRAVEGICPVTLASRLKKLEQEAIIKRYRETVAKVGSTANPEGNSNLCQELFGLNSGLQIPLGSKHAAVSSARQGCI